MAPLVAREDIAAEALTWLGTPYHHHGAIKGVGVDCAHLLIAVFRDCGLVPDVDPGAYAVDWHLHRSEEQFSDWLARYARLLDDEPLRCADIVLFRYGRCYSHGAIALGADEVIHAYVGRGVVRSRMTEDPIAGRPYQHWSMW